MRRPTRDKRRERLRAMFARLKAERSARDVGKVALGAGAALGATFGAYKLAKVAPRIRWGRLAKDVGKLGLGAGAVYGAYKAAPHVREYFSKENRTIRKMQRSMKAQATMLKKAGAYYQRQSSSLEKLDPATRKALFLAEAGNFLDLSSTRQYSKREFMEAMLKAHQYERMEQRVADVLGKPRRYAVKPIESMPPAEQEKAVGAFLEGRGLSPITGDPPSETDIWNRGRRAHLGAAEGPRARALTVDEPKIEEPIEPTVGEPRKRKRKRYTGEVRRDWGD